MPHTEEKATTMMHNIIPLIIFKYGDNMKNYFFTEAVEAAKDDYWDDTLKILMCKTDKNMAEAEESDAISLNIDQ